MILSGLEQIQSPSVELEQYATGGELASRWLADIFAYGDLQRGCTVADLGAGNGVLGLGALELGLDMAILIDSDQAACYTALSNAEKMGVTDSVQVIHASIGNYSIELDSADVIICNPPWGRQSPKADRPFLDAILSARVTSHLMHSAEASHIEPLFEGHGWSVERYGEADFALQAAYSHHSRMRGKTRAAFWRLIPPERRETLPDRS